MAGYSQFSRHIVAQEIYCEDLDIVCSVTYTLTIAHMTFNKNQIFSTESVKGV